MVTESNIWPKRLSVDKRIVRILSGSTYANFPSAIREIIVNSYDADAENVFVEIDLKNEIISIRDDGKGMSENDFSFYLRIAGKSRKKNTLHTENGRRIVGQFGVGFLSVLPFCEKYLIETTKKGYPEIVSATITSSEYFSEDFKALDVDEIPIYGEIKIDKKQTNEHYTRIRLVGFSTIAHSYFNGEYILKNRRNTVNNFPPLELLKWQLSEYLPLQYDVKDKVGVRLNGIIQDKSIIPFNVHFNGKKLYRNVHAKNIVEIAEKPLTIGEIKYTYAILTNYDTISPTEARHLMFRNLNVGVGERTTLGLGLEGKVYGKLAHLTAEVNIIEGLNDLINVSRDKFNFSPDYEKLKDFFRGRLAYWANDLDTIQSMENNAKDYKDENKVSNIGSLKSDKVKKDIEVLKSKGFNVKVRDTSSKSNSNRQPYQLDKQKREVILSSEVDDFYKSIAILDKQYRLKVDNWDYAHSAYPAVRIKGNMILVNESYPLFKNKKQFDTFLKLHILLLEYFNKGKIKEQSYQDLLADIIKTYS